MPLVPEVPLVPELPDEPALPLVPEVVPTATPICFTLVIIDGAAGCIPLAATAVICTY